MKLLLSISAFTLLMFSCSHDSVDLKRSPVSDLFSELGVSAEDRSYVDKNGYKANGFFTTRHENGAEHAELTFADGMITDGTIRLDDGSVQSIFTSEYGLFYQIVYNLKNGKPALITVYKGSYENRVGFYVWHENGMPFLHNNGHVIRMWFKSGELQLLAPLKNGKMQGQALAWHENGQLKALNNFTDDELDGSFKRWNEDGELISERIYNSGELISAKK